MAPYNIGLDPEGCARNCMLVLRIPLVSGQRREQVPAVAGEEFLVRTIKIIGPVTPTGSAAEQVAAESLLGLAALLLVGGSRA